MLRQVGGEETGNLVGSYMILCIVILSPWSLSFIIFVILRLCYPFIIAENCRASVSK
jgi:hypothetical protein